MGRFSGYRGPAEVHFVRHERDADPLPAGRDGPEGPGDRLPAALADDFELAGEQIRFDECMGEWRSMHEVIEAALRRTMARFGLDYREGDARAVYDQIPTWTPYPGVPEALRRLAEAYPLVILTNTD